MTDSNEHTTPVLSGFVKTVDLPTNGEWHHSVHPQGKRFNRLDLYRGVVNRFLLLIRHFVGLLAGALIAHVRSLPPYRRKGLRKAPSRILAWFLTPFVDRELRHEPFAVQLRRRLELMGATYIKLGQIMAIREDILPRSITDELKLLLDRLPEVPFEAIRDIIENALDRPITAIFDAIEMEPIGSASIAQTHRARLITGEMVVVKVIKPGIREAILSDIQLLHILSHFLQFIIPQYQPKMIIDEFCNYTEKEVDLTYEADHAEIFATNFADYPDIVFPKIYREFSSRDVLTMEYLEGIKPNDSRAQQLSTADKEKVIDLGAFSIIKMLYEDGFFHADLHAGNLIILPGPKVGFIDLGMIGRFEERTKTRLLFYYYALVRGDIENSTKYLLALARPGKGADVGMFRRAVADLLRRYRIQASHGQFSLAQLILESLSIGGRFHIYYPMEMTLMVKALVTFEGVGLMLNPKLNIPEISYKHIREIYLRQYHPGRLWDQFVRGMPELLDVAMRTPQILSDLLNHVDYSLNHQQPQNPLAGLRSGMFGGACIVGAVLAYVQGASPFLWVPLFLAGTGLFLFGKS